MDDELVSIAHHEGGHVVAAIAHGREVGSVVLDDEGGAVLVMLTGYGPERLLAIVRRRRSIAPLPASIRS